jgi:cold shock CspA family protein
VYFFQFGFLNYEAEENKKLFFHMTEVHDGVEISPGDEVEFVVVQNQRNQKYSAVSLRKIS